MSGNIHLTLQNKGGVGKTFAAWCIAQWLMQLDGANVYCADTDPTTPTFAAYPALKAQHVNIMKLDMTIDKSPFDRLVQTLVNHPGDCVVDNGASSFLPIMSYLVNNSVLPFLQKRSNKQIYAHVPLIGGLGLDETLRGLDNILTSLPVKVCIWENQMYGPVVKNGKQVRESIIYNKYKDRIVGLVTLQQREEDTWMKDFHYLTSNHMTLDEGIENPDLLYMQQQRFFTFKDVIFGQLEQIAW